jgi:hypothetical protein
MRKIVTVATVVAVVGVGFVAYSLIRTTGQFGRIDAEIPAPREEPARAREPRAAEPSVAPVAVAAPAADTADEPADGLTADERSPFGHTTDEPFQSDGESKPAEGAPRVEGDATSLAPLLADARATLERLLDEAADEPDAAAEVGVLLADRAPLEALLEDPDPAVRKEAAALLELLGRTAP